MKKKLISLLCALMTGTLLWGCGSDGNDNSDGSEPTGFKAENKDIVLTFASWNLGTEEENNINRRMIKAFEEKTGITIRIAENVDITNYDVSLAALAAAGKLPDIIMMSTVPYGLENEWFADISKIANADPDWQNIPAVIEETTHYNEGIYYVPTGFYMVGYFVNDDLFEEYNLDKLPYGCSFDDFMDAIRKMTNLNRQTVGILNEYNMFDWYASSRNKSLGWFTWDGTKYNLDAPEFLEGIKKMNEIQNGKYSLESLAANELAAMDIAGTEWNQIQDNAWYAGKVGIRWAGTWNSLEMMSQRSNFATRFIGIPGGRTAMVSDYIGITPRCKYPEAAYEFLKWISFCEEGIAKRMELDETGTEFYGFPVSNNPDIINKYIEHNTYPGFREALLSAENGIMEINKFLPGYFDSRSYARTGRKVGDYENATMDQLLDAVWKQGFNFADYAQEANRIANEQYARAVAEIEEIY